MSVIEKAIETIPKELIFLDEDLTNQSEVLNFILDHALEEGVISSKDQLMGEIISRENEISTSVGYQVAMPHGKSFDVRRPFVSFVRLSSPIRWNPGDDEEVSMVFLIGVPVEDGGLTHLRMISQLSRRILDEEFRKILLTSRDVDEVYGVLNGEGEE